MKLLERCLLTAGLCLAMFSLAGCAALNVRETKFGPVSALAHFEANIPAYYQIEIERPLDDAAPRIWIRMPDGKILDRTWFTYTNLKKAGFQSFAERDYQPSNRFPQELTRYGASFFFDMGSLKLIRFTQAPGESVSIGPEKAKQFYFLPMTQEQLEKVFGKPDGISDKMAL